MAFKKKREFPTAFTILFVILIIAALLTHIIPAGSFDRLEYNPTSNEFIVNKYGIGSEAFPATQKILDKFEIQLELNKFKDGIIKKSIAIPGTYHHIGQRGQGIIDVIKAPISGIKDTVDIMIFVLILGGIIKLVNKTGAFEAGIGVLSKKTKGKEFILVILTFFIIALGGTTFGLGEETIAFYPILMPIFLISGFDAITCIFAIYMGSAIGFMYSTVNPFSVVIASNAAGINFTDGLIYRVIILLGGMLITLLYIYYYVKKIKKNPRNSFVYEESQEIIDNYLKNYDIRNLVKFTTRRKMIFIIFVLSFIILVWGVAFQGWWFTEMSALFLGVAIIIMFFSGIAEKRTVNTFVEGAQELTGVVLIIGLARAINIIMDEGMISDTLLNYSIFLISGISGPLFAVMQLIIYFFLGFFIPSSSGLAVLTMPIMAPLADSVGLSREVVINAYNWGQGLMSFIAPTGLILVTLEMVGATFNKWLKFILPLMGIIGVYTILALIIQVYLK